MTHKLLVAVLVVAVGLWAPGCLTRWVYDKYDHVPVEAVWIRVASASPDRVSMRVGTRYKGAPAKKTKIRLNPDLDSCESVQVRTRTTNGMKTLEPGVRYDVGLREVLDTDLDARHRLGSSAADDCTVAIFFSAYEEGVSLSAHSIEGRLAGRTIDSPPNAVMLAVALPATVVADVVGASLVIAVTCLPDPDCGRELLESLETSPSEEHDD